MSDLMVGLAIGLAIGLVAGWAGCYWAGRKNRALFDKLNEAGNKAADAVKNAVGPK